MKEYIVISDRVRLPNGNIILTKDQARRRLHRIKHIKNDTYNILTSINFKRHETFKYDGQVSRAMHKFLQEVGGDTEEVEIINSVDEVDNAIVSSVNEVDSIDLYDEFTMEELLAECALRKITFKKNASQSKIIEALIDDDKRTTDK